jgi:hypothetical protein
VLQCKLDQAGHPLESACCNAALLQPQQAQAQEWGLGNDWLELQSVLILGYLCDIGLSLMYLCSDVFDGLVVSCVVSLSSCTKCHVALIM